MAARPGHGSQVQRSDQLSRPLNVVEPRPPNPPGPRSSGTNKSRTSHACDRCRLMRTKCSGGSRCTKCVKDDAVCAYGDRKRERNKKDLAESVERVSSLEEERDALLIALRTVTSSPSFRAEQHKDVVDLLSKIPTEDWTETSQDLSSHSRKEDSSNQESAWGRVGTSSSKEGGQNQGERSATSDVGSPGRQGELFRVVDLNHGTGAAGFVGKMSETSWIQRVREYVLQRPFRPITEGPHAEIDTRSLMTGNLSYFMDDANLLAVDEDHVEAIQWPPFEVALILSEAYFHARQGGFHFVHRGHFFDTLKRFPRDKAVLSWAERQWLAQANLMWAIGSKWLHMTKLTNQSFADSHLMYYARARALGLDHRMLFDHPDTERVQAIGLLAFYLLANGSIARAWTILGHAMRHATALGLHMKVTDPTVDREEQARRAGTWYSLYSLEILIAEITGRPKSVSLAHVTVPVDLLEYNWGQYSDSLPSGRSYLSSFDSRKLWLEFLGAARDLPQGMTGGMVPWRNFAAIGQNVSPSHFPEHIRLCIISDRVADSLYTGVQNSPWSEIQRRIGELQTDLSRWAEELPDELNIRSNVPTGLDPRAKIELSLYFHSVQMILHRPCLCNIVIENESTRSEEFNRSSARACVHAAMSMLAVMPDNPSAHEIYQLLPWWSILHYIAQAAAVLLLELCLVCQHFSNESHDIAQSLTKAMAYLWHMAEASLSAYKAFRIFRRLISDVASRYDNLDVAGIPEELTPPAGWNEQSENDLQSSFSEPQIFSK